MLLAFGRLLSRLLGWLEPHYLRWTQLPRSSPSLAFALDLTRPRSELLLENALLRQQLLTLQRHVKRPSFTHTERLSLLLLASRLKEWRHLLLILQPDTLLRWHRQGLLPVLDATDKEDEPEAIGLRKGRLFDVAVKDNELLAEESIFGDEIGFAACEVGGGAEHQRVTRGLSEMEESLFERREQADEWLGK